MTGEVHGGTVQNLYIEEQNSQHDQLHDAEKHSRCASTSGVESEEEKQHSMYSIEGWWSW